MFRAGRFQLLANIAAPCLTTTAVRELPPRRRGFERIAAMAVLLSPQRARMLDMLLEAIVDTHGDRGSALRPIWQAEAAHRAECLAELILSLDHLAPCSDAAAPRTAVEHRTAARLATTYQALTPGNERDLRACAPPLCEIAVDLVSLFSPLAATQPIQLNYTIECISLPAFKQRALVLLCGSLITNSLTELPGSAEPCRIDLALWRLEPGLMQFTITDYPGVLLPLRHAELVADLVSLIEGDLACHALRNEPTRLDIVFPIRA